MNGSVYISFYLFFSRTISYEASSVVKQHSLTTTVHNATRESNSIAISAFSFHNSLEIMIAILENSNRDTTVC